MPGLAGGVVRASLDPCLSLSFPSQSVQRFASLLAVLSHHIAHFGQLNLNITREQNQLLAPGKMNPLGSRSSNGAHIQHRYG